MSATKVMTARDSPKVTISLAGLMCNSVRFIGIIKNVW